MEKMEQVRKGPWTEQEDVQLVFYVNLFGDRRWDFIAKVSGLKRTGKSCRLRWVNYLHPGLKRGKMTPHEEKLVLELHSKWGNRWSRIARKIPGRTDNEIKNYWRTHMRKKAHDDQKKKRSKPTISPSSSSSSSFSNSSDGVDFADASRTNTTGGEKEEVNTKVYSMDEIWKDIELSEESSSFKCGTTISSTWDICNNTNDSSLWSTGEEDQISKNMLVHPILGDEHFLSFPFHNHMIG